MDNKTSLITLVLMSGLAIVAGGLFLLTETAAPARADAGMLYVAPGGNCGGMSPCYENVQEAVDAAGEGDVIKVAVGTYTGVSARAGITQAVYISKTVTIQGGYTTANWNTFDPEANPAILDAQGKGRVLYISTGNPTIEGLHITGGYVYGYFMVPLASAPNVPSDCNYGHGAGMALYHSNATLIGNTIYSNTADGASGGMGGGVYLYCSDTVLIGNIIYSNTADGTYGSGGGVYLGYESDATLVGNVIRDNVAVSGGGVYGGASFYADTYAMLVGNTILNNTAQRGGGVYLGVRGITLINNIIADNYAEISGSGIYIWGGDYRLLNNTLARNTGGDGSGVFVSTYGSHIGTVVMTNTILADQMVGVNVATSKSTAILNGVLWSGNGANTGGAGAITVTNAVTGDPAFVDPDGGDYHIGPTSAAVDQGLATDSLLDVDDEYRFLAAPPDMGADEIVTASPPQCQARLNGGGPVYATLQAAITASTFASDVIEIAGICEDVVPWNGGSVVAALTKTLTVRGGYSPDFDAWDPNAYPTILNGHFQNRVLAAGAGISPTIEYLTLFGGRAVEDGGGLCSVGDGPTLRHLQVAYSSAERGGGIYLGGSSGYLEASRVVGNRATLGGGVYVQSITATLNANLVQSNWATDGGGVYLDESEATLDSNTFNDNTTSWHGGGVYLDRSATMLDNNTISGNISKYGGGIYLDTSKATLNGSTVGGNTAKYGGGVYLYYSDATLSGNTIASNTARDRDPYHGGVGGGVYLRYSDATLSGNTISDNTATWNGGGGYLSESAATLNGNIVSGNTAKRAGGLYLDWYSNATLNENTITNNAADYSGGGVYLHLSPATLSGNTISGNAANGLYWQCGDWPCGGGGVFLEESPATLSANTITANTAQLNGGGLVMWESNATLSENVVSDNSADYGGGLALYQSDVTSTNDAVFDNRADVAGGGLYVYGSSPRLLHVTIARNSGGDGKGMHVTQIPCPHLGMECVYSHVALTNTILVSHTVGITVTAGNTATLDGVLWFGNGEDIGGAGSVTVTNAITGDPTFAADNYHLTLLSAAFDAGVDAGALTDIDGDTRPQGAAPDLGADEIVVVTGNVFTNTTTTLVYTDTQGLTTTIQIPAGAVTETTLLIYAPMEARSPSGFAFAGHGFDLEAYRDGERLPGFTFDRPVTVTIRYSEEDVRLVTDESQLFLGWWTGSGWEDAAETCDPPSSYSRDVEGNEIGVAICHLSRFGLFGPTRQVYLSLVQCGEGKK